MNITIKKTGLLFWLFFIALTLSSQTTNIQVSKEFNNTPLVEVLKWLEKEHQINIAYSENIIEGILISETFEKAPLEDFFETLLKGTPLAYRFIRQDRVLVGPVEVIGFEQEDKKAIELIQGKVLDHNGEALAFAHLFDEKSQTGVYTDEDGSFEWPLTSDSAELQVSYVGFETQRVKITTEASPLLIRLTPSSLSFKTIEVVSYLPAPEKPSQVFSTQQTRPALPEISVLPGGVDVFRNLQLLPGVKANDHLSAQLRVRAGNPDENLIVLDGMMLYNIDHFYGFFSAIHPGIFEDIQIHKNVFPIEFNGRTSSIVQLNSSTNSKAVKSTGTFGADLISAQGLVQLPLSGKMSLLAAGRFTHQDIANTSFFNLSTSSRDDPGPTTEGNRNAILNISPSFHFNDLYLKWQWSPDPDHFLSASVFNGFDRYKYNYSEAFQIRLNAGRATITEEGGENTNWRNTAYGFQFGKKWNKRFSTRMNFNYSSYSTSSQENFTILQSFRELERVKAAPESEKTNEIAGARLDIKNAWEVSRFSKWTFGYTWSEEEIDFQIVNSNGLQSRMLNKDDRATTHSLYGQYTWTPSPQLEFTAGLNAQHYGKLDSFYVSPRIQTRIHLNPQWHLKASWSRYNQFLRQLYHEDVFGKSQTLWVLAGSKEILPRKEIPRIRSRHLMLGSQLLLGPWEVDIELYHKTRDGIMEYTLRRPGFNREAGVISEPVFGFFTGEGWTRGMDLLIKKTGRKYTGWIAYTLSKSVHQLEGVNFNRPYPSPEDSRHQLSFMNQWNMDRRWTLSANYIFASGLPYLDYSEIDEIPTNRRLLSYDQFLKRYPAYHRLDLSLNYKTRVLGQETLFGLSVFNALNRNNVKYRQFVFALEEEETSRVLGTELELLPRVWNLSIEMKF